MQNLLSSGGTDPGKKRQNNEDSYLADDALGLYAVADGIGGHQAGEVASRMAVDTLAEVLGGFLRGDDTTPPFGVPRSGEPEIAALLYAVTLANQKILAAAANNAAQKNMGTTVTALLVRAGRAYLAHVGDSRAYLLRDGTLSQLTNDHSLVAEALRAGTITAEQARTSANRHIITRAVGLDRDVAVDQGSLAVRQGDLFLLCTDGLTEMVDDGELLRVLSGTPLQEAAARLIATANQQGGVDNITAVVAKIEAL